tara:strand:- start:67 stop:291 length:225 start_codon:yes stop_codon:yes gene_type:complete
MSNSGYTQDSLTEEEKKVSGSTGDNVTKEDFSIKKFEDLLERLEASKKRQQRQRSVEGRRDIFAQGLAGMMSNF